MSQKPKILIVEDEQNIAELLTFHLQKEGYEVLHESDGRYVVATTLQKQPVAILLDLMLPFKNGLDICREIRAHASIKKTKIIMLTAKGEESDIVSGLELGADDYITKPFSPKVVVARLRNVLRRTAEVPHHSEMTTLSFGPLKIQLQARTVSVNAKEIDLTYSEFSVLLLLTSKPGWVFSRTQIVDAIRGEDYAVTDRVVDVLIVGLRRKLKSASKYITTSRGVGYKFDHLAGGGG